MKRVAAGFVLGLLLSLSVTAFGAEVKQFILKEALYPIFINGKEYNDKELPILNYDGNTYVPLAKFGDLTGVDYVWNDALSRVEINQDGYQPSITSKNVEQDENLLTTVDGTGKYSGYKMLKGYPEEGQYQIYYKGTADRYNVTYEDLRGINFNEMITWKYGSQTYKNTRTELYSFFSDTRWFRNNLNGITDYTLTNEWFLDTFGEVYMTWAEGIAFSTDATRWVQNYFEQTGQSNKGGSFITLTPGFVFEQEEKEPEEQGIPQFVQDDLDAIGKIKGDWITENDLYKIKGITVLVGDNINDRKIYEPNSSSGNRKVLYSYTLPKNWTQSAQPETVIDGLRMKYDQKDIYYYIEDLYDLGILSRDE